MTAPIADRYDLMVREETTSGTLATFAPATDGVLVLERPSVELAYLSTGQRGPVPGTLAPQRRAKASGRSGSASLAVEAKGRGGVYSGTDVPADLHTLLKVCGLTATFSASPSPNWLYALNNVSTTHVSASLRLANGRQQYDLRGAIGTFSFEGQPGEVARFVFALQGIANLPVDQTILGGVTYPGLSIVPPVFEDAQIVIGSWSSAVVRRVAFELGRAIGPRGNANVPDAHSGFAGGAIAPRWRITVEATSLVGSPFHTSAGLDPFRLISPAGQLAPEPFGVSCRFGSVQYNRGTLNSGNCTLLSATPGTDGSVETWDLEFEPYGANPFTITVD